MKKLGFLEKEVILFIILLLFLGIATYFDLAEAYENREMFKDKNDPRILESFQHGRTYELSKAGYKIYNMFEDNISFKDYDGNKISESEYKKSSLKGNSSDWIYSEIKTDY